MWEEIEFTGEYEWKIDGWVSFRAIVNGTRVTNRISEESLSDYFGSNGTRDGDIAAYWTNREKIHRLAAILIDDEETNEYGGADITTEVVDRLAGEIAEGP